MSVTRPTSHAVSGWSKGEFENIAPIYRTLETFHVSMGMLKDVAPVNMPLMSVTAPTSHAEMSALKDTIP